MTSRKDAMPATFNDGDDLTALPFAEYHPTRAVRARHVAGKFEVNGVQYEDAWLISDPAERGALRAMSDGDFRQRYRPHYGDTVDRIADIAAEAVRTAALTPPEADPDGLATEGLASEVASQIRSEATP